MLFYILLAVFAVVFFMFRSVIFDKIVDLSMSKYRWISVLLFVLPLSKLFEWYTYIRNRYVWMMRRSPQKHTERVKRVQGQLQGRQPGQRMCTARPSWLATSIFHPKYKDTMLKVDLNDFTDILEVDEKRRIVRCEPLVSCGQLTHTLAPLGWQTAVIPELDDLTVGGLIAGFGVEGSSFKYGLFQHICEAFEIILPSGELVRCSKDENPELFYNIPWSYGTLGFLVSADIKIVPARKFIHLKYEPCFSKKEWIALNEKYVKDPNIEYIETLVYSKDTAVVMTGVGVDKPSAGGEVNALGNFYKPWFYKHVASFLRKAEKQGKKDAVYDEYIPTADYFHRHTKSLFWEVSDILTFGNHPLFRYTLGWLIPPKVSFLKLFTTEKVHQQYKNHHVDQDMLVPMSKLSETIDIFHKEWTIYPLWICPCLIPKTPIRGLVNETSSGEEMFVDVGAYGVPHVAGFDADKSHRAVEKFVRDVEGFQALYAATYQTKEELMQMFDHTELNKLRKKYKCEDGLPEIYDKVSRHARGH